VRESVLATLHEAPALMHGFSRIERAVSQIVEGRLRCALALACVAPMLVAPLAGQARKNATEERTWADCLTENLRPFRKNYLLPVSFDSGLDGFDSATAGTKDTEVKFQISLRYALTDPAPHFPAQLFLAYTALSHWQLYDTDGSSPFRTTDHQPELFFEWCPVGAFGVRSGVSHQSNGEDGVDSRSWNQVYVEGLWNDVCRWNERRGNEWGLALKVWHGFDIASGNDDIEDYLGHFELRTDWTLPFDVKHAQLLSLLVRNNFDDPNRGAIEVSYSRDLIGKARLLFQYFNGYGESLLDYKEYAQRFSVGFEFSP
jgi:phospholipase A1